jgi:hypothetical protein
MLIFWSRFDHSATLRITYDDYNAVITIYGISIFYCAFLYLIRFHYEPYIQSSLYKKDVGCKKQILIFSVAVIFILFPFS